MKAVPLYRIQADSNRSTYIRASQSMKREGKELGCVDISSEPYESTDEVQESQETR